MGLFEKLKAEFIDIIEWLDSSNDTMIYRFERYHNEIKYGARLVVRESQVAVFVNEGQVADVFEPGSYTLETKNMPILTTLKGWKYGFNSPFKAEVYFASTRNFTDRKWGTKNPIPMRDAEIGYTRLRAFGTYAIRIQDPVRVIREIAGTDGHFTADEITDQLRNIIISRFTDTLAEAKIPAIDLATQYDEFGDLMQDKISPEFEDYGFQLTKFLVENISFPPEVEAHIDKRSSMGIVGDLNQFMQFQTATALTDAAKNQGSGAGEGVGLGMGFAMAQQMANVFQPRQQPQAVGGPQQQPGMMPPPVPTAVQFFAVVNGQQAGPYPLDGIQQLVQQRNITPDTLVWRQGMPNWVKASEVPELAGMFAPAGPPPIPPM